MFHVLEALGSWFRIIMLWPTYGRGLWGPHRPTTYTTPMYVVHVRRSRRVNSYGLDVMLVSPRYSKTGVLTSLDYPGAEDWIHALPLLVASLLVGRLAHNDMWLIHGRDEEGASKDRIRPDPSVRSNDRPVGMFLEYEGPCMYAVTCSVRSREPRNPYSPHTIRTP